MLDATIRAQLGTYLQQLQRPIEIVAALDDSIAATEMRGLLREIAELSRLITLREDGQAARRPSFSIGVPGETPRVVFFL